MNTGPTPLDLAVQRYRDADEARTSAIEQRDAALFDILKLCPPEQGELNPDGVSKYHTRYFDLSVTGKLIRTLDQLKLPTVEHRMRPGAFAEAFADAGYRLNLKGLRAIEFAEPDQYAIAVEAITSKPGKPAIKITLRQE